MRLTDITLNVQEEAQPSTEPVVDATMQVQEASRGKKIRVEGNILRDVHLVGLTTKNFVKPNKEPYTYKEAALEAAVDKYENVDIFVGHTPKDVLTIGLRDPSEKIGFISNVKFKAKEGLFGDITLNEKHPNTEAFIWWAEHKPEKLMMSHEAQCTYNAKENAMTAVHKVDCVAFVSEGSTTTGLFKEGVIKDKIDNDKMLNIIMDTFWSCAADCQYPLGKMLPQADRAVQLIPVIKDLLEEVSKLVPTTKADTQESEVTSKKESTMEYVDITLDALAKQRKDLVDAISAKAIESHIKTEEAVAEALAEIPEDHRSDLFKKQVREAVVAGDDKLVDQIVSDRKSLVEKAEAKVKTVEAPAVKPGKTQQKQEKVVFDVKSIASLAKKSH
jgi:hypothetical protein